MKKNLFILMALLLPLSVLEMRADDESIAKKIPLEMNGKTKFHRGLVEESIVSCYYGVIASVCTYITTDLGEVDITVVNSSTGESWYDSFDSSTVSQHQLVISSSSGLYEVTYVTQSGDILEGSFVLE